MFQSEKRTERRFRALPAQSESELLGVAGTASVCFVMRGIG